MSSLPFEQLRKPREFALDPRFSTFKPVPAEPEEDEADPVAEAFERGRAQGLAEAREEAMRLEAEREAAREKIEMAFARFDEDTVSEFRERLRLTVLALCEEAVLPLAIDEDGLVARIERASAMLQRAHDDRRVLLHPQDLKLVKGRLPDGLILEADDSVERGGLRIETPDGGIEDGPKQWRIILAEAFREC